MGRPISTASTISSAFDSRAKTWRRLSSSPAAAVQARLDRAGQPERRQHGDQHRDQALQQVPQVSFCLPVLKLTDSSTRSGRAAGR
jgi:hypothetical protein